MPCLDAIIYFFLTIGVKLGDKIGVRNTVILTFVLHYSSYFILIFAKNFYFFLISMVIFGIGHAISNLAVIKNTWKYFPNNISLVYGIIVSGAGMCSSIFIPLADYIVINPEKKSVDKDGFYPEAIAMRLLRYLIIATGILSIFGALSIFFTFDNNKNEEEKSQEKSISSEENKKEGLVVENEKEEENKNEERDSNPDFNALENDEEINKQSGNKRLLEAFLSVKNMMFIAFCFCSFCKYITYIKFKYLNLTYSPGFSYF